MFYPGGDGFQAVKSLMANGLAKSNRLIDKCCTVHETIGQKYDLLTSLP
jgi:hypothetical protein